MTVPFSPNQTENFNKPPSVMTPAQTEEVCEGPDHTSFVALRGLGSRRKKHQQLCPGPTLRDDASTPALVGFSSATGAGAGQWPSPFQRPEPIS